MSKSLGNVIYPEEVIKKFGAEILRLWVSAEDYRDDIRISPQILQQLTEAYRRIRNTCRFLLGNIADFDSRRDLVPYEELEELDRWVLHRLQKLTARIRRAFERYDFHVVYHSLYQFCTNDLSAFYLDILKDRLYTSAPASRERRSGQTALLHILKALVRLMAPVLSFTAEEIWSYLPEGEKEAESVHLTQFPPEDPAWRDEALEERWERLLTLRGEVTRALERARQGQIIGHPLDARVRLLAPEPWGALLRSYAALLPALFIVSQAEMAVQAEDGEGFASEAIPGLRVWVTRAAGEKCERCWNYREEVGERTDHPTLCRRCLQAIAGTA